MRRLLFLVSFTVIAIWPGMRLCAAPVIDSVASNATHLVVNVATPVTVTAVITDPGYLQGSANLQRRGTNGTWTVLGTLQNVGGGQYRIAQTFAEAAGGTMRLRVSAAFRGVLKRALSPELLLQVGVIVQPSANEQIINGPPGTGLKITIQPNALTEPALIGIASIPASEFPAPTGNLPLTATLNLIVRSLDGSGGDGQLLAKPLHLSLLAPNGTPTEARFYVAQPLFTGSEHKLLATDTARVVGAQIVTQGTTLAGTFGGGPTAILREVGSGYAEGAVLGTTGVGFGANNGPRSGVLISNGTNFFVYLTDNQGRYKVPISSSPPSSFLIAALDPVRCTGADMTIPTSPVSEETVVLPDLQLPPTGINFVPPVPTRTGFLNGGFEASGNFFGTPCWRTQIEPGINAGLPIPINLPDQDFFGNPFTAFEGNQMFRLSKSISCISTPTHPCRQPLQIDNLSLGTFMVPAGASSLRFNFRMGCQSCPPIGPSSPIANDTFSVELRSPSGILHNLTATFSDFIANPFWHEGIFDVGSFAGTPTPLTLAISNANQGDNFPTESSTFYIDNLRFGTVFVDVKIVDGAMADLPDDAARFERVRQQVRDTNEILAQAGINVQIRNIQIIPDPGNLLETDMTAIAIDSVSGKPELPPEVAQLNTLNRSSVSTDVNVYYVGALKKGTNTTNTFGLAVGPDDYHMTDPATQRGLIIRNLFGADLTLSTTDRQDKFREVLAHELGHLLIHGVAAEDAGGLEHTADSGNVMSGNRCTPPPPVPDPLTPAAPCSARAILKSEQAAIINQNGSGLIVP